MTKIMQRFVNRFPSEHKCQRLCESRKATCKRHGSLCVCLPVCPLVVANEHGDPRILWRQSRGLFDRKATFIAAGFVNRSKTAHCVTLLEFGVVIFGGQPEPKWSYTLNKRILQFLAVRPNPKRSHFWSQTIESIFLWP